MQGEEGGSGAWLHQDLERAVETLDANRLLSVARRVGEVSVRRLGPPPSEGALRLVCGARRPRAHPHQPRVALTHQQGCENEGDVSRVEREQGVGRGESLPDS